MGDRRSYYSENYTPRFSSTNYAPQNYSSSETRSNSDYPADNNYQQNRQFQQSSYSRTYQESGNSRPHYENKINSQSSFTSNRRFEGNTYPEPGYRGRPNNSTYRSNEQTPESGYRGRPNNSTYRNNEQTAEPGYRGGPNNSTYRNNEQTPEPGYRGRPNNSTYRNNEQTTTVKTANYPEDRPFKNPYKYVSPNYANKTNSLQFPSKSQTSYSEKKHEDKSFSNYSQSPAYNPQYEQNSYSQNYSNMSRPGNRNGDYSCENAKESSAELPSYGNKEEYSNFRRNSPPSNYGQDDKYANSYDNPESMEDEFGDWENPNDSSGPFQNNLSHAKKRRLSFQKQKKGSKKFKPNKWKGLFKKDAEENDDNQSLVKQKTLLEKIEKEIKNVKYEEIETAEEQIDHINARSAPLLKMPYEEQLKLKYEEGKVLMSKICANMSNKNRRVKEWLDEQSATNNGEAYKMHDIIHKETDYNHYKTRIELIIGLDPLTQQPTAGLRCGTNGVAPLTDDLLTMPQCIIPHIRTFEKFLKQSSVPISKKGGENDGAWKQLSFKVGFKTNQIMMIVGFTSLKMVNDLIGVAKTELRRFYSSEEGKGITSLYFHLIRQRPKGGPSFHLNFLMGEQFIEEIFDGVRFKISPQSQTPNSQWGAELVKDTVKKMGRVTNETALIDIGSPLATVSLCLAKECKIVHFIVQHLPSKARVSLKSTAPDNGITNWRFSLGNIADHLHHLPKKLFVDVKDALIYIDPWSSLRGKEIIALRQITTVKRLLFLTCGKKLMLEAFNQLVHENPNCPDEDVFVPVEAAVIDSYPHTTNMSTFVLLERLSVAKQRLVKTTDNDDNNKESC